MGSESTSRNAVCVNCHQSGGKLDNLSPGHRLAASIIHGAWKSQLEAGPSAICLSCHSEHGAGFKSEAGAVSVRQFDEQTDHPYGVVVRGTAMINGSRIRDKIDGRLRLVDSRLECLTCHDLTENNLKRIVIAESETALCIGCHEFE